MNSLLFGISLSALLSVTSLLIVLFRASPLTAPVQAIPAFFASLFLSIASVTTLALLGLWRVIPWHTWDTGKLISISMRQGILLGLGSVVMVLFHLLKLLNWWIAILIVGLVLIVEVALEH